MGKFAPEQGCIELYDQEGACAHLTVGPGFVTDILPMVLNGEEHSYNEWRNSLYWKIRNAGFQSEKAVEVGQRSDDAGYSGSEGEKPFTDLWVRLRTGHRLTREAVPSF